MTDISSNELFGDLYSRFRIAVEAHSRSRFPLSIAPPVSDAEIKGTEAEIGVLPQDIKALLNIHNGGYLFDNYRWLSCSTIPEVNERTRQELDDLVSTFNPTDPDYIQHTDYNLSDCLILAAAPSECLLYENSPNVGRIAFLSLAEGLSRGAPSLEILVRAYVYLAEEGCIRIDSEEARYMSFDIDHEKVRRIHDLMCNKHDIEDPFSIFPF